MQPEAMAQNSTGGAWLQRALLADEDRWETFASAEEDERLISMSMVPFPDTKGYLMAQTGETRGNCSQCFDCRVQRSARR